LPTSDFSIKVVNHHGTPCEGINVAEAAKGLDNHYQDEYTDELIRRMQHDWKNEKSENTLIWAFGIMG
jgi:hypothetical protein